MVSRNNEKPETVSKKGKLKPNTRHKKSLDYTKDKLV